jgi:alkylhydroperoxidase family enzyme
MDSDEAIKPASRRPGLREPAREFYRELMLGDSELSRGERELLAVVVSAANKCDP